MWRKLWDGCLLFLLGLGEKWGLLRMGPHFIGGFHQMMLVYLFFTDMAHILAAAIVWEWDILPSRSNFFTVLLLLCPPVNFYIVTQLIWPRKTWYLCFSLSPNYSPVIFQYRSISDLTLKTPLCSSANAMRSEADVFIINFFIIPLRRKDKKYWDPVDSLLKSTKIKQIP